MRITYARTAQISGCPDAVLDQLSRETSISSEGDKMVMMDIDDLKEYVESHACVHPNDDPVIDFLSKALSEIEQDNKDGTPVGEVILLG